jgi:hypothetical protein
MADWTRGASAILPIPAKREICQMNSVPNEICHNLDLLLIVVFYDSNAAFIGSSPPSSL